MFQYLLLTCIEKLRGERTVSGIFHLLTGKRSSQTMQDAKGYRLDNYFAVYTDLERESLDNEIGNLERRGCIRMENDAYPALTVHGKKALEEYAGPALTAFDGMAKHTIIHVFRQRLNLLIQTWTNINASISSFVPMVDDPEVQQWVKRMYAGQKGKLTRTTHDLFDELQVILNTCHSLEAGIFTYRMTGGGVIGLTVEQLAREFKITEMDVRICLEHMYYRLYQVSEESFPILSSCKTGLGGTSLVTESAKRTYHYLEQGYSLDDIVSLRRLKKSTIQDHVVEAALVDSSFRFEPFMRKAEVEEIIMVAQRLDTKRLKRIKEALDGRYDYFQLRLALAVAQHFYKERKLL
ncbi:helix-turn-helix domain-containing protein [Halobacillus sp. BAB-2008]|uniref:helix-turn-helix domain-containing protein n=1 Tax=Halobacillus sp. BAB-2008 TaxID=1246484 RepID=UPI0002A51C7B|nr:helix-turn-helix domain-containing protein [Halobacillus sp. BAB-2008]ELK45373.1 hypothetical protein D479_15532 [Halobacillus sp. BAB-2008]